jgi:hypothetical protein
VTTCDENLYSVVGLAVDRGALYLSGGDVTTRPIAWLARRRGHAERVAALLQAYSPPRRGALRSAAWLGWLGILGRMEPIMRGFVSLSDIRLAGLPRRLTQKSAAEWLAESMPAATLQEIAELLRLVRDTRVRGRFVPNPVFGCLGVVTGSDGDWIAGSTLVELKCVRQGMRSLYVAQLLCYYVLDRASAHGHEPFGFDSLALSLPRQGVTISGTVGEWLGAFGAPPESIVVPAVTEWLLEAGRPWGLHEMVGPPTPP